MPLTAAGRAQVMQTLQQLASEGHTVVCSIHQVRSVRRRHGFGRQACMSAPKLLLLVWHMNIYVKRVVSTFSLLVRHHPLSEHQPRVLCRCHIHLDIRA